VGTGDQRSVCASWPRGVRSWLVNIGLNRWLKVEKMYENDKVILTEALEVAATQYKALRPVPTILSGPIPKRLSTSFPPPWRPAKPLRQSPASLFSVVAPVQYWIRYRSHRDFFRKA
jgi:hypothetical protein